MKINTENDSENSSSAALYSLLKLSLTNLAKPFLMEATQVAKIKKALYSRTENDSRLMILVV